MRRHPYNRLWRPRLLLAALNTEPSKVGPCSQAQSCARRLRAAVVLPPSVARDGLGRAFIDPALSHLERPCATLRFRHQLRRLELADDAIKHPRFWRGSNQPSCWRCRHSRCARPWPHCCLPESASPRPSAPSSTFISKRSRRRALRTIAGIVNGTAEWLFAFPDRLSVTIAPRTDGSTRPAMLGGGGLETWWS